MWLCPKGRNATPAADPERQTVYVISTDGRLYALDLATGNEKFRAVQFVPPFSKNWASTYAARPSTRRSHRTAATRPRAWPRST